MITNWTGEGENEAALVIQWNDDREKNALVFGYRWDGMATGADMIRAVVANNPRLYGLIQYTNVSSPTDPDGGYTINGFGWDLDDDGDIALIDTKDNQIYTTEDGLFIHPRGYVPARAALQTTITMTGKPWTPATCGAPAGISATGAIG